MSSSSQPNFETDDRFDGLYMNVANTTRGIDPLLDTVFSFLRRKTDFFTGGGGSKKAIEKVNQVLNKHVAIYEKEAEAKVQEEEKKKKLKKKQQQMEEEERRRKKEEEEEDVIELGKDGFDISSATNSDSAPKIISPSNSEEKKKATATASAAAKEEEKKQKEDNEDNEEEEEEGGPAPEGNGGTVEGKYVWTQTLSEVTVIVPLPDNTRGRDLNVEMKKKHLKIGLKSSSSAPLVNAPLTKSIIVDDSFWTIEDHKKLVLNLQKVNQMEWWDSVCVGDPVIDVKKVQPENSSLGDLDGETRQTVEKMMYDQRQKAMGLPTADEQKKWDILEKFKKQHPEMDFSNAKMS